MIVPLVAHVTATESGTPCDAVVAAGVKAQPVAVPALTKSEPVTPETFSLKIVVNENGYRVGVGVGMSIVAVGDVLSTLIWAKVYIGMGPGLPLKSTNEDAGNTGSTVPSLVQLIAISTGTPASERSARGVNVQPCAVPVLMKTEPCSPSNHLSDVNVNVPPLRKTVGVTDSVIVGGETSRPVMVLKVNLVDGPTAPF